MFWHLNLQKRGLRQMKTIEMIYRVTCRHCRQAFGLTELQGGKFELYLDGDLFKVTIVFPKAVVGQSVTKS